MLGISDVFTSAGYVDPASISIQTEGDIEKVRTIKIEEPKGMEIWEWVNGCNVAYVVPEIEEKLKRIKVGEKVMLVAGKLVVRDKNVPGVVNLINNWWNDFRRGVNTLINPVEVVYVDGEKNVRYPKMYVSRGFVSDLLMAYERRNKRVCV